MSKLDTTKLDALEEKIEGLRTRVHKKITAFKEDAKYDFAEFGIYLLAGRELHKVSLKAGRKTSGPGFTEWVAKQVGVNIRTSYHYMNLAENAGLTAESTIEDVEALRSSKALEGRKLAGDLYLAPAGVAEEPSSRKLLPDQSEFPFVNAWRRDLKEFAAKTRVSRDQLLEAGELDNSISGLRALLESLTMTKVVVTEDPIN